MPLVHQPSTRTKITEKDRAFLLNLAINADNGIDKTTRHYSPYHQLI